MDRRIALKNLGLSFGYIVATPTILSLVQSCKEQNVVEWMPSFLSKEEGSVLYKLVDIILPKTDTPSATDVNVHVFIDKYINEIMEPKQQDFIKLVMTSFNNTALHESGKEKLEDLNAEDLEAVLASSLKYSKEDEIKKGKALGEYHAAVEAGENPRLDDSLANYALATNLRGLTIWSYKTSEKVGEEVLAYLPVPGEYIGCGDVNELTEGKAWSIE